MTWPSGGSYSASVSCGVSWASVHPTSDERSKRLDVTSVDVDRVIILLDVLLLLFLMLVVVLVDGAEECLELEVEGDDEKSVDG